MARRKTITPEEREAERAREEAQRHARRVERVAKFCTEIEREKNLKVFPEKLYQFAFDRNDKPVAALYFVVNDFVRISEQLERKLDYIQGQVDSARQRFEKNEASVAWSTNVLTDAIDVERLAGERHALARAVSVAAYAADYHVPQIESERERDRRARRLAVAVVQDSEGVFRVRIGDGVFLTEPKESMSGGETIEFPIGFPDDLSAWEAAMGYCGESIY